MGSKRRWTCLYFPFKKGVKFHDGSPLTAEDFVYSWTRAALTATAAPLAYHLSPIKGYDACQDGSATTLEGVKALDDRLLQVTLSYPYADFITTLGHVVFYPVKKADIEKWGQIIQSILTELVRLNLLNG